MVLQDGVTCINDVWYTQDCFEEADSASTHEVVKRYGAQAKGFANSRKSGWADWCRLGLMERSAPGAEICFHFSSGRRPARRRALSTFCMHTLAQQFVLSVKTC
jgi:hypothetical protein